MINKIKQIIILLISLISITSTAQNKYAVEVIANKTNTAGNYGWNFPNGIPALDANLNFVSASVYDSYGNLFVVDKNNNLVRKIDIHGTMTTVAGKINQYLNKKWSTYFRIRQKP
jgi:hypothetical protein